MNIISRFSSKQRLFGAAVAAVLPLAGIAQADPVSFPYSTEFEDASALDPFDFTTGLPGSTSWDWTPQGLHFQTVGGTYHGRLTVDDRPAGEPFTVISNMTVNSFDFDDRAPTVGLWFLRDEGSGNGYHVDFGTDGLMRLLKWSPGAAVPATKPFDGDFATGVSYELKVELGYDGSDLIIDYTVTGNGESTTLSYTDTDTVHEGDQFGFRHFNRADHGLDVTMHDLSVVPEPGTLGLIGMGALFMLNRRRRRQ